MPSDSAQHYKSGKHWLIISNKVWWLVNLTSLPNYNTSRKEQTLFLFIFVTLSLFVIGWVLLGNLFLTPTRFLGFLESLDNSHEAFKTSMLRPPIPSYAEVVPQLQSYELLLKHTMIAPQLFDGL